MIALALLLQAAQPVTKASAAPPERFSILARPCGRTQQDGKDVVVCANDPATSQRLPYPDDYVPDHGVPSNPRMDGLGALAAEATPCAARVGGCQVGIGPPIVPIAKALIKGVTDARKDRRWAKARAADGNRRVPIDLSQPSH